MEGHGSSLRYPNGDMESVSTAQKLQRLAHFAHMHSFASVRQPIVNLGAQHLQGSELLD